MKKCYTVVALVFDSGIGVGLGLLKIVYIALSDAGELMITTIPIFYLNVIVR